MKVIVQLEDHPDELPLLKHHLENVRVAFLVFFLIADNNNIIVCRHHSRKRWGESYDTSATCVKKEWRWIRLHGGDSLY